MVMGLAGWSWGKITLVEGQAAKAVVVTADEPTETAAYAARELVDHVARATGVRLEIITESKAAGQGPARVYVGATKAAKGAGIDPEKIPSDVAVLRGVGDALYIVGHDGPGKPLDFDNVWSGTLWGVYELLERDLGVHWLFPGDLGIDAPKTERVTLHDWDERVQPKLVRRHLRQVASGNDEHLGFTAEGRTKYLETEKIFLRRLRMGRSDDPRPYTGHSFTGWWQQYGQTHPEWFQLRFDGGRGPGQRQGGQQAMCVSNPEFHKEIIRRFAEERKKNPNSPPRLSIGENDVHIMCTCETCRSWDDPQPTAAELAAMPRYARGMYYPFNASARYARFWKTIYDMAVQVDKDVIVTAFAYSIYFPAPKADIKLNPNIVLGFVPYAPRAPELPDQRSFFFPRQEDEQRWVMQQWDRWKAMGATLFYRPNYTLDGYAMPHIYTHQVARVFQYYLQNGCIATDFDSLVGQWSAQGPTMYALARLQTRPDANIEEILDEYYKAFGPAAPIVREYFDYWEKHTMGLLDKEDAIITRYGTRRLHTYAKFAHEFFPIESFAPAQAILDRAAAVAQRDGQDVHRQRIGYLQAGLTHALLCVKTAASFADANATAEQRRAAIVALVNFRHAHEGDCIANYHWLVHEERQSWTNVPDFIE